MGCSRVFPFEPLTLALFVLYSTLHRSLSVPPHHLSFTSLTQLHQKLHHLGGQQLPENRPSAVLLILRVLKQGSCYFSVSSLLWTNRQPIKSAAGSEDTACIWLCYRLTAKRTEIKLF